MKNNGYSYSRAWFDYAFEHPEHVTASHGILYLWLVEINNRVGWVDVYQITASECMQGMGCKSYNTYKKCFEQLVEWGFVKVVKKAVNQHQCNIIALSKFDKASNKALDKALMKHLTKQSESTVQSNVESNCDIHKQVNNKPKTKNHKRGVFTPPSENDIYNFMGELNTKGQNFLNEVQLVNFARTFMDHYQANGWIVGKVPMKDWQSTVRNWMRKEWDKVKNQKPKNVIQNEREKRASELEQFRKQYRSEIARDFGYEDITDVSGNS